MIVDGGRTTCFIGWCGWGGCEIFFFGLGSGRVGVVRLFYYQIMGVPPYLSLQLGYLCVCVCVPLFVSGILHVGIGRKVPKSYGGVNQ